MAKRPQFGFLVLVCSVSGMLANAVDAEGWHKILEGKQYKRLHLAVLETGLDEGWDAAMAQAEELERRMPDDPETALLHAVIHARLGSLDDAMTWCNTALARGLDRGRLAAEAHNLLTPLASHNAFQALVDMELVHGPMLGNVTSTGAWVWLRMAKEEGVGIVVTTTDGEVILQQRGKTRRDADYTAVMQLDGLQPATEYLYTLRIVGKELRNDTWHFRTADPAATSVRIAFGGGAGYTPENERMWDTIRGAEPDVVLLLGDNVYIDNPTHPEIQRYCYYRRQSRPEFRRLVCNTPVYAVWDDHDFGINDCWYGTDPDSPSWKRDVLRVFQQNWVNPAYGGGAGTPGVWFTFERGPVRVIMTDGRYYRSDPAVQSRTMLGAAQTNWLLETLRRPPLPFTLLASGVPWAPGTKGTSRDTWDGYPEEREQIFTALDRKVNDSVLLLSADRHRTDIWKIERPAGNAFYEFESSRLTNIHVHETMEKALFSYNEKQSFGVVKCSIEGDRKGMELTIMNIDGDQVHSMHIP